MAAAHATHKTLSVDDRTQLGERGWPVYRTAMVAGLVGLVASVLLGFFADHDHSFRGFFFAYLAAYGFWLSIGLGGLFFVLVQHLTKAGWSVSVRRVPEAIASTLPVLGILSAPLVISVLLHNGALYPWALPLSAAGKHEVHEADKPSELPGQHGQPDQAKQSTVTEQSTHSGPGTETKVSPDAHGAAAAAATEHGGHGGQADEHGEHGGHDAQAHHFERGVLTPEILAKRHFLNPAFFTIRMVVYVAIWSILGLWYWRQSVAQDADGDVNRTVRMQAYAPVSAILLALSLSFGAVDLMMSLDPIWYSTIFGVYYFAGAAVAIFAVMGLTYTMLQRAGYLRQSVTIDHYHDIGKFLFAFVFFWGYIAFSQFMLLWYGNIPEETQWFARHGATTVDSDITGWTWVGLALLFGHLLIPFAGLLSRHVKRSRGGLVFWSVWMLVFHYVDIHWIVMPEMGKDYNVMTLVLSLLTLVGVGGVVVAAAARSLSAASLLPTHDPRLDESMLYSNP